MIGVEHGSFPFIGCHRRDKQVIANLNLDRTKVWSDFALQKIATDDVTAFHHDDLAFRNVGSGEHAFAVDRTWSNFDFRRAPGERNFVHGNRLWEFLQIICRFLSHFEVAFALRPALQIAGLIAALESETRFRLLLRSIRRGRVRFARNFVLRFRRIGLIQLLIRSTSAEDHRPATEENERQVFHRHINNKQLYRYKHDTFKLGDIDIVARYAGTVPLLAQ
jgi:hypothetical protein